MIKASLKNATQGLPLSIRPATPADGEDVARIYMVHGILDLVNCYRRPTELSHRSLSNAGFMILASPSRTVGGLRSVGSIVGIGPSRDPVGPQLGELDTIAVDPPHWRTGIGMALISLALKHLVLDGYSEAILWKAEGCERGTAFYEAMGWARDGRVRDEGRQIRFRRNLAKLV